MGASEKVWGEYPVYYKQPIRWARYHAHTKPHFFFSVILGLSAPAFLLLTPLRRKLWYEDHEPIPKVYPLPTRERNASLVGYDDN